MTPLADTLAQLDAEHLTALARVAAEARTRMVAEPTSAHQRAYLDAKAALDAARAEQASAAQPPPAEPEPTYKTLAAAVAYLRQSGRKASKSKLDRDLKKGLLARNPDGVFTQYALDKYGGAHCRPLVGAERRDERLERLAEQKLTAEARLAELKAENEHWRQRVQRGEWVSAEAAHRVVAQLAAQLRADVHNYIHAHVPTTIEACGGDADRTPEVLALWQRGAAEWMGRYHQAWLDHRPLLVPTHQVEAELAEHEHRARHGE